MPEGFKIADAFVSVVGDVDRVATDRSAGVAGERAGRTLGEKISKESSKVLGRDSKGRFTSAGTGMGTAMGGAGSKALVSVLSAGMGNLSALASNPYLLAAGAGIGIALAPVIMGALSSAITAGAGLGLIGLGAVLLKDEPALISAATRLKDRTVGIFKQAAKPMLAPFIGALGTLEAAMGRMKPQIESMFAAMAPAIEPLAKGLAGMFEGAMPGLTKLVEAAGPFLIDAAPSFEKLGNAVGMFASMLADVGPESTVVFKDLIALLGTTIVVTGWLIASFTRVYVAVRNFFTAIPGWISGAAGAVGTFFTVTIPGWLSSAWSAISGWGVSVGGFFAALPGRIMGFLSSLPGRAAALFTMLFDGVTFAIGYGIGTAIAFFIALPGRVLGFMRLMGSVVSSGVSAVVGFFTSLPGRAASAVSSLWSRMVGFFTAARSGGQSQASSLVSGVVNFLVKLPGKAASAVAGVASAIGKKLREAVGVATGIGADIIRGLIGGITGMIGAAVDAAKRAVGSIIDGAKEALEIGSPSKVADRKIGRWLLPGVVQGVKRSLPAAKRAVGVAVSSLVPGRDVPPAGLPRAGGGGGPTYHFAAGSITLDASKIRDIQDVVELIGGINRSARGFHAGATV